MNADDIYMKDEDDPNNWTMFEKEHTSNESNHQGDMGDFHKVMASLHKFNGECMYDKDIFQISFNFRM